MIKILEKNIADKIAAGEVIDRPVSIVKELVENSIDAGADNITVEIRDGGKSYIRVTDNGSGISPEETEISFKRHATSKISSADDLNAISTLGFRGEALASICAVSRVDMITKTATEKAGCKLTIEGSEIFEKSGTGCPDGTTITVRDLFYNVPARLKFLATENSESRRIIDMVSRIALSYGDIKFTLINGRTKVFVTRGDGNIFNNIVNIYGKDIARDLLPVESADGDFVLKGFVSSPSASAASRSKQIFCVNGRVVSSKVVEDALESAYKEKLFAGRFPMAFLFLSLSPDKLDVNIHPTKKEIRFEDKFEVSDFIQKAVRRALTAKDALAQMRNDDIKHADDADIVPQEVKGSSEVKERNEAIENYMAANEEASQVDINKLLSGLRERENEHSKETSQIIALKKIAQEPFSFENLTFLGTVFNTYIMACDDDSFYLIDQHAAHERVFYEKLLNQYNGAEKYKQELILPLSFDVSAHVAADENAWMQDLSMMGYAIENFGEKTYIVREIPAFMELNEAESFLSDVFKELEDNPDLTNKKILDKIIMRSCKSAVKGGDVLKEEEISALMKDLKNCVNPFSCPHGRPTFVRMTKYEIEKMFKRV